MFNWLKKLFVKEKPARVYNFSSPEAQKEAYERSLAIRKLQSDVKIAKLERELATEKTKTAQKFANAEGDPVEQMFINLLMGYLSKGQTAPTMQESQNFGAFPAFNGTPAFSQDMPTNFNLEAPTDAEEKHELSDEEIKKEIAKFDPEMIAKARKMPDFVLRSYAKKHLELDNETINRAIKLIKYTKDERGSYFG